MAQSSVAREPTMEEILASIRRIIESNDEAGPRRPEPRPKLASIDGAVTGDVPAMAVSDRQDDDAAAVPEAANDIDDAMPLSGLGDVLRADESMDELARDRDADADDAEMAEADLAMQPLAGIRPGSLQPAISLADVAAKLRGREEPSRGGETTIASKQDEAPAVDTDERRHAPALEAEADRSQAAETVVEPQAAELSETAASSSEPVSQEDDWEMAMPGERKTETTSDEDVELSAPAGAPAAQAAEKQAAALVSTETSTKVAAAFGELNEAIERGKMRSFEEIAEEMLRPMLAEWLDDNLPTLVERLVREEIERVAQGGRR